MKQSIDPQQIMHYKFDSSIDAEDLDDLETLTIWGAGLNRRRNLTPPWEPPKT
jgi:hypothetical protein